MSPSDDPEHQTPSGDSAERAGAPQPADPVESGDDMPERGDEGDAEQDASTAPLHPVPAPGEPAGDMWPGVQAVRAESDDDDDVRGIEGTALAPPGKPDGEADTRP